MDHCGEKLAQARAGLERQRQKIEVLENANAMLEELLFRLSLLNRMSEVAQEEVEVGAIADRLLELLSRVLKVPACGILAWDGRQATTFLGPDTSPDWEGHLHEVWTVVASGGVPPVWPGNLLFVPIRRGHREMGILGARLPIAPDVDPRQEDILALFARELGPLLERGFALARVRDHYEVRLDFIRSLTHDLRNPLTGILSTMLSLTSGAFDFDRDKTGLLAHVALRSARQLDHMLDDLLDVYTSEAGKLEAATGRVDAGSILADVATNFGVAAYSAGLDLDVAIADDLPPIAADERLFGRVVGNLLANAIKFTPSGGIRVSAAYSGNGDVVMRVDDSGKGIPLEARKQLFTPFFRGKACATEVPGTGLGLAFCKVATTEMGGRIWIEDSPLGGTAFCIALPIWEPGG